MYARSAHFIFQKKVRFKHLAKAYPEVFKYFLTESRQMPEEKEFAEMLIRADMTDLEKDRKPEGYNRQGRMRLIFPIRTDGKVEFYIYRHVKSEDTGKVAVAVSKVLNKHNLKHSVQYDKMVLFLQKDKKKRKQAPSI